VQALPRWMLYLCIASLGVGCNAFPVVAEVPAQALSSVAAEVIPAVVAISADRTSGQGTQHDFGTGFVIDQTGLILTNKHVIEGASSISVTLSDGTAMMAMLVGEAMRTDVALLQVFPDTPLRKIRFGDSDKLQVADTVIAIGNPAGFNDSVTVGVVSGLNRDIMESPFDEYIQTDAAINHGNSGGPLVDTSGEVIGMNSVIIAPGSYGGSIGLNFAIPSDMLKFISGQLRQYGQVRPAWIGARFQQATPQLKQGFGLPASADGAVVLHVMPNGPAAAAGLQLGDIVLEFNGAKITDVRALARGIAMAPIDHPLPMRVWRAGARQSLTVTPVIDPQSGAAKSTEAAAKPAPSDMSHDLGLQLADLTAPLRMSYDITPDQAGVVVTKVAPQSEAATAGLHPGDLIVRMENCETNSTTSVTQCLHAMSAAGQRYVSMLVHHDVNDRWVALPIASIN
jgi:serine protease Do